MYWQYTTAFALSAVAAMNPIVRKENDATAVPIFISLSTFSLDSLLLSDKYGGRRLAREVTGSGQRSEMTAPGQTDSKQRCYSSDIDIDFIKDDFHVAIALWDIGTKPSSAMKW
jgi:hypothetical protein